MTCNRCYNGEATHRVQSDILNIRVCSMCAIKAIESNLKPPLHDRLTITHLEKGTSNANQLD